MGVKWGDETPARNTRVMVSCDGDWPGVQLQLPLAPFDADGQRPSGLRPEVAA